jgi:Icc-related predicted phosphoesterase
MFRIIVTGDIHWPYAKASQIKDMCAEIHNIGPDVLAIIGDIAEVRINITYFQECLNLLRVEFSEIPILVLPGNHDLWIHDNQKWDSRQLFDEMLPTMTRLAHCHWLETENFILDEMAIVGSYLHYDYSAKDKVGFASTLPDLWFEQNKDLILNDRFMKGLPADVIFAKELGDAFRMRLQTAQDDDAIKQIIVLTHVPCMEEQITRNPQNYQWAIATPYFGNLSHQDLIKSCDKVRFVVSGHSHQGMRTTLNLGNRPEIEVINLDADYGKPQFVSIEVSNGV